MKRSLSDHQLEDIARVIKEKIYVPLYQKQVTVFLCGADIKDLSTGRSKMASVFAEKPRYKILYPEDLFDDLLAGQGQHSLLELEDILASSVDALIIFPESPGSFAELGAFSNNKILSRKLIAISQKKYKGNKSFINYGPYRLIKQSKSGKVIHINYDDLCDSEKSNKIYNSVNDYITKIKKNYPVEKNVANILESENFILPCIYLLEGVNNISLYKLLESATSLDSHLCKIATKSSLGCLIEKRYITRNLSGYTVTSLGSQYVRETFDDNYLDRTRIEIMHVETRRNSTIRYDRITSRTFSE